jgi:hypothetical protein
MPAPAAPLRRMREDLARAAMPGDRAIHARSL